MADIPGYLNVFSPCFDVDIGRLMLRILHCESTFSDSMEDLTGGICVD